MSRVNKGTTGMPVGLFSMMKEKALTLMEILVATLIMALILTGLANVFVAGKRHILRSRSRMSGAELGRYFLEPLQMQVRQDQWASNCLGAGIGCPSAARTINGIIYTPSFSPPPSAVPGTTLRRVRVSITWDDEPQS